MIAVFVCQRIARLVYYLSTKQHTHNVEFKVITHRVFELLLQLQCKLEELMFAWRCGCFLTF